HVVDAVNPRGRRRSQSSAPKRAIDIREEASEPCLKGARSCANRCPLRCRQLALNVGSLRRRNLSGVQGRPDSSRTSRKWRSWPWLCTHNQSPFRTFRSAGHFSGQALLETSMRLVSGGAPSTPWFLTFPVLEREGPAA